MIRGKLLRNVTVSLGFCYWLKRELCLPKKLLSSFKSLFNAQGYKIKGYISYLMGQCEGEDDIRILFPAFHFILIS